MVYLPDAGAEIGLSLTLGDADSTRLRFTLFARANVRAGWGELVEF